MWRKRCLEPEILDQGAEYYTAEEYEDCLIQLGYINRFLGSNASILASLRSMPVPPTSILDVGCGGGFMVLMLAKHFPKAEVAGIDINPRAIEFASQRLFAMLHPLLNARFELRQHPELSELYKSYDVVIANLMCHHLDDDSLLEFLKRVIKIARKKVVINDLQRHYVPYYLFKILSRIFSKNLIIQHDGALSIRKALTRKEWIEALSKIDLSSSQYTIRWQWSFRWLIEITL